MLVKYIWALAIESIVKSNDPFFVLVIKNLWEFTIVLFDQAITKKHKIFDYHAWYLALAAKLILLFQTMLKESD